jgi:Toprim domain
VSEKWSQLGHALWSEATPIDGTLAEVYLNGRGIRLAPWPAALRFHPAADHTKLKQKFPALIARVIGAAEASFQFTYLSADGKGKAAIDKEDQRRTLGSNKGGVVVLAEVQPSATLLAGEGVETTMTAMEATGLPGVAVLGVSGLANVDFSPDVAEIILLAENDENSASRKAIDKVCPALLGKGLRVRVAAPPVGYCDFNDLLRDRGVDRGSGLQIAKMAIQAAAEWKPKRATKPKGEKTEQSSQASFLVEVAASKCELFTDAQGEAYASFAVAHGEGETHRETHKIRSRGFNRWLRLLYYRERGGSPNSEAMSSAIKTVEARAFFDGDRREAYLRVAALDGRVYVDLCNERWQAIEIDADGWRVVDDVPVHFRREAGMLPLPMPSPIDPKKGVERLKEVLRLRDEGDFVMVVAWALAALAGRSPYVVLVFIGEPGSTKTSSAFAVRSLIDPNASPLRSKPKDVHEVYVAASHSLVVAYNNLSHLPDWLSDTICTVSEGSGESQRELFTNADESLIIARAPFLITSIENVVRRGDLAQRALFIHLANVPDNERMTEERFKLMFRRLHADVLGALCGAVAHGLRVEKTLKLKTLPRMASFYRWLTACETALWPKGTFAAAFEVNVRDATEDVIEGEKAAFQLRLFMTERGEWGGTATQLLVELIHYVRRPVREAEAAYAKATEAGKYSEKAEVEKAAAELREAREKARDVLSDGWPKAANALSGKLKRASPALRKAGVVIEWPTRHGDLKTIKIRYAPDQRIGRTERPDPPGRPEEQAKPNLSNNLGDGQSSQRDGSGLSRADPDASRDDPCSPSDATRRDDLGRTGTTPGRSAAQSPSRPSALETNDNQSPKNARDRRDDTCGSLSGRDPTSFAARVENFHEDPYLDEDDPDEDDRPEGGKGIL